MRILGALTRLYVPLDRFAAAIDFHAALFGAEPSPPFTVADLGVTVCRVGPVLVLTGPDEALSPMRGRGLTLVVDSLDAVPGWLAQHGGTAIAAARDVPTGRNLHAEHPGGVEVEYVELRRP